MVTLFFSSMSNYYDNEEGQTEIRIRNKDLDEEIINELGTLKGSPWLWSILFIDLSMGGFWKMYNIDSIPLLQPNVTFFLLKLSLICYKSNLHSVNLELTLYRSAKGISWECWGAIGER